MNKSHNRYKHGHAGKNNFSPLYKKWMAMKRRCLNKNEKCYPRYGGAGVTISKEWMVFENFLRDMGDTFNQGLSLERIDNKKGYSKENCKWIPMSEQSRNRHNVKLYSYDGRKLCIAEWERVFGFKKDTLLKRIKRYGWTFEEALLTPVSYANRYR